MKKKSLLISLTAALAVLIPHFLIGLTFEIDRAYAKDLTNKDVPYYAISGNKITRENFSMNFKTDEARFRYFEPSRLPVKVFVLTAEKPLEKKPENTPPTKQIIDGNQRILFRTELLRDPNPLYSTTERFTVHNETLKNSLRSIEVTIADKKIKAFRVTSIPDTLMLHLEKNVLNFTSKQDTLLVHLEKDDLKKVVMAQGLVIRNELSEPLVVKYFYNNATDRFFTKNDLIDAGKTFYTRQPLISLDSLSLEKITLSDARGTLLKTFTPEELLKQPATETNPLIIRDFLPLTLTLDNQSDALLTLQKTVEMYNLSLLQGQEITQYGATRTKQEPFTIKPHTKNTYILQANTTVGKVGKITSNDITSNDELQTFKVTMFNSPQELILFPSTPEYCSNSRFTIDLHDKKSPLLDKKQMGKPFALTLTVAEEADNNSEGVFEASCKKLTFSLAPTPTEKK